jgi:aminopeptidase N
MSAGGEIVSMGANRSRRAAVMKRKPKLTDEHRLTIRFALRRTHNFAMGELDFTNEHAGHWLITAGETWDAYKAFAGTPMHDRVHP